MQIAGAPPKRETHFQPLSTQKFFSGLWTQRSPFNGPDNRYYTRFLGGRPDMLIDGENIELTNYGTLIRRPGLLAFSTVTLPSPITGFYSFHQTRTDRLNPVDVMVDTASGVYNVLPTSATLLYTKAAGALQAFFQGVGNTLYIGDGVTPQAWNDPNVGIAGTVNTAGTAVTWVTGAKFGLANPSWAGQPIVINGVTYTVASVGSTTALTLNSTAGVQTGAGYTFTVRNWGIAIGAFASAAIEPPGTGTDVAQAGGTAWANPGNILAADAAYASVTLTGGQANTGPQTPSAASQTVNGVSASWAHTPPLPGTFAAPFDNAHGTRQTSSQYLTLSSFGLNVPTSAVIKGLVVTVSRSSSAVNNISDAFAVLGGGSDKHAGGFWPTVDTPISYGSPTDLWGTTWTPAQVNASGLGFKFRFNANPPSPGSVTGTVSSVTLTVYYTSSTSVFSDLLEGSNYGYLLSGTIQGIAVTLKGYQTPAALAGISVSVQLMKGNLPVGSAKILTGLPASNNNTLLGSSSDLWGADWSSADINATGFGVAIQASSTNTTATTLNVDFVQVTVYASGGPTIAVSGSAGSLSATVGFQYALAYGNSNSAHVSSTSLLSNTTGVFTNKANVAVTLTPSADPQVNQIWVFRTNDGGTTLFNLPNSPTTNTSQSFLDTAPSPLPVASTIGAALFNDPPVAGLGKMAYHLGRIWGVDAAHPNTLYYSAGPDIVLGNGNEAFPPGNSFVFPCAINRLVPVGYGLLVFTTNDVYQIVGTAPPFYPVIFQYGLGLLSYNALDVLGDQIFMLGADRQLSLLNAQGVAELGYAVGDVIESTFDPTLSYVAALVGGTSDKAVFLGDGTSSWLRCNWNQPPEGGPAFSPRATFAGGVTALGNVEVYPGQPQLLVGTSNGTVAYRSMTTFTDLGAAYTAFAVVGSLVLAQPGQLAEVESITVELQNRGTLPTVSVMLDEISSGTDNFEALPLSVPDPPVLAPSLTVMSRRFYLLQAANPVVCRHMQMRLDFIAEPYKNELLTLSVFGAYTMRE